MDLTPPGGSQTDEAHWPYMLGRRSVDHVLVVLSDIEMGGGGVRDDFPQSDWIATLLRGYNRGRFRDVALTLVLNGDTFDFLKTCVNGTWPTHIDASVALAKFELVAAAHPGFFAALDEFLSHPDAPREVQFVVGNHDPELALSAVQEAIRQQLPSHRDRIHFPGLSLRIGDVHIEHGCQADPLFAFDPSALLIKRKSEELVNMPWGSVALLDVAMPLSPLLYHHDRLKPREELLALIPEIRRVLTGSFWRYWTRDYWKSYFADQDPLRRLSWTMMREVAYRLAVGGMDINLDDTYHRLVRHDDDARVCVIGHTHEPAWHNIGDRKLLQTGCLRNEFALLDAGRKQSQLPKVYAEVYLNGGRTECSHLVEVHAPPPPAHLLPQSIFSVQESLRDILREQDATEGDTAAQQRQECDEQKARDSRAEPWSHRFDFVRTLKRAVDRGEDRDERTHPR